MKVVLNDERSSKFIASRLMDMTLENSSLELIVEFSHHQEV
jgi:hypothetical protein